MNATKATRVLPTAACHGSTANSGLGTSFFTLPMKRGRSSSREHDLGLMTRSGRRKQLRIEIPNTTMPHDSYSQHTVKPSSTVKESPSSLFSAASNGSLFDDKPSSPSLLIPETTTNTATSSTTTSTSSNTDNIHVAQHLNHGPALLTAPPIPGLYFDPSVSLPQELAKQVLDFCMETYFQEPNVNQVMLFGRAPDSHLTTDTTNFSDCTISNNDTSYSTTSSLSSSVPSSTREYNANNTTGLPAILETLLLALSSLLKPSLPANTYALLFPLRTTQARQAIINLYTPGEGISSHVDLLKRYGDGIIGVSFGSNCVIRFDRCPCSTQPNDSNRWDLFLPERSVLVLTEDARYNWTHGIDRSTRDYVSVADAGCSEEGRWIDRGVRLSVTFRWLLPGADIVGPSDDG